MVNEIDRNLFIYLTKAAGYELQDVARIWGVSVGAVYRRLNGEVEIRRGEMDSWMRLVGASDAGPIFFPGLVAKTAHETEATAG